MNKAILLTAGLVVCIFGIAGVLRYWSDVVTVFRGIVPTLVAVIGLVIMFAASLKK